MADQPKKSEIEGEGNYTAAREYQKEQHEFAKSGQVKDKARDAANALDGPEGAELEKARQETAKKGSKA